MVFKCSSPVRRSWKYEKNIMETKKSVRYGLIKQAIMVCLLSPYLVSMLLFNGETQPPIEVKIIVILVFGALPCIAAIGAVVKNLRNPKNQDYSATLKICGDFLVIRNPIRGICRDEKRIPIRNIKRIELSGRRFVARLKGFGFDFETTFDASDKSKLQVAVEKIGQQTGIDLKINGRTIPASLSQTPPAQGDA
jgi:hypothetical protein